MAFLVVIAFAFVVLLPGSISPAEQKAYSVFSWSGHALSALSPQPSANLRQTHISKASLTYNMARRKVC